ncbi:MAG TPA: TonB-dependent receptor plug domain-containing protein, partial [Opitutaceae bacterium]
MNGTPSVLPASLPGAASAATRIAAFGLAAVGILAGRAPADESAQAPAPADAAPTTPEPKPNAVMSLPAVEVTGTATTKPHDIPQSIETVTQQVMAEQAVTSMQDVLRNVPGITINAGEGGAHGDSVNLRGIS